jgi:hypothetical protein
MSTDGHRMRLTGWAILGSAMIGMALAAGPALAQTVAIDKDDIGGVVRGANGPEAGVWVIAETTGLPTRYAKSVVTDDQGRYVIPDLPAANYQVWVRGYGLVDSPKLRGVPGTILNHTAVLAPDEKSAAHYYPAIYWYSMLPVPKADQFGGASDIPKEKTLVDYLKQMKNIGCVGCHQMGQESTRTIPANIGAHDTTEDAWLRRIQSGQAGEGMVNQMGDWNFVPLKHLAAWSEKIAKGALPPKPPRPQGAERNVVVTWWEWGEPQKYLHDLISSDRRNPTVNGYGLLVGNPELSTDNLPILDPKTNKVSLFKAPVRDQNIPAQPPILEPSPYWGEEVLWDTKVNNHNAMFDAKGRVWLAARVRGADNPAFCKQGSDHPSAKAFPIANSGRQLAILEPSTMKYSFVDTCFGTHHLQFGYDADDTLWLSGTGQVVGWLNSKVFLETGDAAKAQGWAPYVLDTNGNGQLDAYVEPNAAVDPTKDKRIAGGNYAVMPNKVDGSVWYTVGVFGGTPGFVRFDPKTKLSEVYNVPLPAFGIRGGDIDSKGVVWASISSGHVGSFDRSKCKGPLNGPKATGDHCPEGWTFYKYPGPGFEGLGDNSAESSYYTWVDQHNVLGLGNDVPISTGNLNDGMLALKDGQFVVLRVPYPMGHYSKGLDGRIDDPAAGWKGRGLWTASGDRTPWLKEGGKGTRPLAVQFQIRPDPLAH